MATDFDEEYKNCAVELHLLLSDYICKGNEFARTGALMLVVSGLMAVMHSEIAPERRKEMADEAFAGMREKHDASLALLEQEFPDDPPAGTIKH